MTTTYFVIMAVSKPLPSGNGIHQATVTWTPKVAARVTRSELFRWAQDHLPENLRGGTVLFFSAEPDVIEAPGSARR
ncbi:Uncharacterised protein [Mycobacterium tuberculosis]|nr:Uncharacterised protein [Mycobacterium tuberculosis]